MLKLGLTGSIATGKSTVLAEFARLGVPTFSADAAVHELYRGAAREPVEAAFPGVVKDGVIDREALSQYLLRQPGRIGELEAIIHPLVRQRIAAFLEAAERAGAPLAVVDIPLLFETGFDWGFDAVAVTHVAEEEQRRRALARPGMHVEKLNAILARQLPQAEKLARATYRIDTGASRAETAGAVAALVEALNRSSEAAHDP